MDSAGACWFGLICVLWREGGVFGMGTEVERSPSVGGERWESNLNPRVLNFKLFMCYAIRSVSW